MAVTNYYTIDGQILCQQVLGEAEGKDYLLDASGNLVGVYQGDYLKADASYDAFGNILDSWNISFYNFTWGGGFGYRQTFTEWSSVYVRARPYSKAVGSWLTVDPLWPSEMPYGYVRGRVPGGVDPSGMQGQRIDEICGNKPCETIRNADFGLESENMKALLLCMLRKNSNANDVAKIIYLVQYIKSHCAGPFDKGVPGSGADGVCIIGPNTLECSSEYKKACEDKSLFAQTVRVWPTITSNPPEDTICNLPDNFEIGDECTKNLNESGCGCVIFACDVTKMKPRGRTQASEAWCHQIFYHEMIHCSGLASPGGLSGRDHDLGNDDFVNRYGQCLCKILYVFSHSFLFVCVFLFVVILWHIRLLTLITPDRKNIVAFTAT